MPGLLVYQKTKFFESWIPDLLGMETKAGRVKTERAHHTLAPKLGLNQGPRPVLIRFHNFADPARHRGTVKYVESTVTFFQDLSAVGFEKMGAKYMTLYPSTLKIITVGRLEDSTPPLKQWLLLTL